MPPRERHLPMSRRACASRTGPRSRSRVRISDRSRAMATTSVATSACGVACSYFRGRLAHRRCRSRVGLGRVRGSVLRVLRAVHRPVPEVLRRALGGTRHAGSAAAVARLARAPCDSAAVPDRHPRPDPDRIDDRGPARLLRSAHRAADAGRWLAHSDRAQRRKRCLRHRAGRRRDERHADALLGWIPRHPVRAPDSPPDAGSGCRRLCRRDRGGPDAARHDRIARPAVDRRRRRGRQPRLHRAAAEAVYQGLGEVAVALDSAP